MLKRKLFTYSIVALIAFIVVFNFGLIIYGFSQLKGQLRIIWNAEPIENILSDQNYPDSIKSKLLLIQEIKQFAFDSLSINPSKNYSTFYDQKGKYLLWVLTAAEPYEMESYKWKFPLLGKVSYKGFFNKKDGIKEQEKLKKKGYDTDLGVVGAWSTLGWFKDPVLSTMLKREEGNLANLIIHELTHGTLYVKDNVEFNENLASFIGERGALNFLANKYGIESQEYNHYIKSKSDEELFGNYILSGAQMLDSLYKTFQLTTTNTEKKSKKTKLIDTIVSGVNNLELYNKKRYLHISSYAASEGNTFFLSYKRYRAKQTSFEEEFNTKFNGNLKEYLQFLKEKYPSI